MKRLFSLIFSASLFTGFVLHGWTHAGASPGAAQCAVCAIGKATQAGADSPQIAASDLVISSITPTSGHATTAGKLHTQLARAPPVA